MVLVGDHRAHVRVPDHPPQFLAAEPPVQRHRHDTGLEGPQQRDDDLGAIGQEDREPVAWLALARREPA